MNPIARFVTRPTGRGNSDIILGAFMQGDQSIFKPNTIYELYDVLGTINVREVGPSLVAEGNVDHSPLGVSWNMQYQDVGIRAGKYLLISRDEYEHLQRNQQQ